VICAVERILIELSERTMNLFEGKITRPNFFIGQIFQFYENLLL
jgi:hypothetical protein